MGSSWTRDRTRVSCTGRRILYQATREVIFSFPHAYLVREARIKRPGSWESSATVQAQPAKALGPLASTCCSLSHVRLFVTPWAVAARLLCPWGSPGKSAGMGSYVLLQGIFPTQGSNAGLLRCWQILHSLSQQGSVMYTYILSFLCFLPI